MEYVYAALLLHESGEELNEENITDVLDAAGVDVEESRVKALVAALEDVDITEAIDQAAAVPAGGAGGADASEAEAEPDEDEGGEDEETAAEDEGDDEDDEEEDVSGEGLGDLFG